VLYSFLSASKRWGFAIFGVLAGCSAQVDDDLETLHSEGHDFKRALAQEYHALSQKESRLYNDTLDARHFAMKSLEAREGKEILPEDPEEWQIPASALAPLTEGRDRLLFALNRGGRYVEPDLSAKTQVLYDCMLGEIEEARTPQEMRVCYKGFFKHLDQLETAVFQNSPAASIMFDYNEATLNQEGLKVIQQMAARIKQFHDRRVMLVGHTDAIGKQGYNRNLSLERAQVVKHALISQGISGKTIKIAVGRGELKSSKYAIEPYNRSVGIYLF
jgi:OOP family OmpA-OmpF porin